MDDNSDGAMIALLPTTSDWCKIDLPHLTLVYAGKSSELKPTDFNEMAKDAASIAMMSGPISLKVIERTTFGPDTDRVDVFRLMASPELWAMRRMVEDWNASEFPFNPHVTIGPVGTLVDFAPMYIAFDRVMVEFGTESIPFKLTRGGY